MPSAGSNELPTQPSFWNRGTPVQARQALVETLRYELLGPASDDEILRESPISRYIVGALAPFGTLVAEEEAEELGASPDADDEPGTGPSRDDDQAGQGDGGSPMSQALTPSSIGLSCLVHMSVPSLHVDVRWGDYARLDDEEEESDDVSGEDGDAEPSETDAGHDTTSGSSQAKRPRRPQPRWGREPVEVFSVQLELQPGSKLRRKLVREGDAVWVEYVARAMGDAVAVSIFLVNRRPRPEQGRPTADAWIFQPELVARTSDGTPFLPRDLGPGSAATDQDLESNELLYRNRREFAVGHGVAATWGPDLQAPVSVGTSTLPEFQLPRVEPTPLPGVALDMGELAAAADGAAMAELLRPLVDKYREWIADKRESAGDLTEPLSATAADHLDLCSDAADRIEAAIELLQSDHIARRAFQFANAAMRLQRSHTEWASERQDDPAAAPAGPTLRGTWRPFQLAFILLSLRGIVDPTHPDRETGDLLWFPTGGGKTEAYLGLAAFTMALRRLRTVPGYRSDAGTAILMRYTLRLLTIQQFQRATALLCACEVLRREDQAVWGSRRFTIGLWLGRQATPNKHAEARTALTKLRIGDFDERSNPCQLESCPWCGEDLRPADYRSDGPAFRTRVFCPRLDCEFAEGSAPLGLPVVVVDDEIYRECPTLVIATVDKLAQMPWEGEVQALFGRVSFECSACGFLTPDCDHKPHAGATAVPTEPLVPPELIIQDELHLISGPLGTMVGLYETAVDRLCTRREGEHEIRPKVIASTATIRRAYEQIRALFDRGLCVFPPMGLEPEDSFFAAEDSDVAGRLYLGVVAPGKSMKTALIRVSAALLSVGAGLREDDARTADPYLTVVQYFNSLRELGGAVRLMDDDIRARLDQLHARGLPKRGRPIYEEMTSRVQQTEIPRLLRRLKTPHDAPRGEGDPLPIDAILASNMISVGVDVNRLGLMTVLGQPKTTAEYIQATSRVGRQLDGPGLVVTVYNWVRPRDLSHLERFRNYHATLYRHVEAVSVTPFSARARDRGLAGAFVAMHRLRDAALNHEQAANVFDPDDASVAEVRNDVVCRARGIVDDPDALDEIDAELQALRDQWADLTGQPLRYGWRAPFPEKNPPPSDVLMRSAEGGIHGHWKVPGSLREVEDQSLVYLRGVNAPKK